METVAREDLGKLSYPQLRELHDEIGSLMRERENDTKTQLRNEFIEKAKSCGFDPADLLGGRGGKRKGKPKGSKAEPKYRDRENPENTWSGRGRIPKWLQERVDAGGKSDGLQD